MSEAVAAVRWNEDREIAVGEATPLAPGAGEVQLAVGSVGICGSDLHFYRGELPARPGITPGHEFAGTVRAVGAGVKHVKEGDHVGVEPLLRCGICHFCVSGDYHVCDDRGLIGERANGGMSEVATVPAITAHRTPSGVDSEGAAIAEPLACSVHGFNKVDLKGHETVFIVGAGSIGLTGILAARAYGAKVIVLARHPHQQEAALRLGAIEVVGDDEAGVERMRELAAQQAIDVAVETVGGTADTLLTAQQVLRPKGRVLMLGVFTTQATTINPLMFALYEHVMVGAITYASTDGHSDYATALDVVADFPEEAKSLITHRFGLEDAKRAFETADDKATKSIKVHIKPGGVPC